MNRIILPHTYSSCDKTDRKVMGDYATTQEFTENKMHMLTEALNVNSRS